jgi:four helix bundle protein
MSESIICERAFQFAIRVLKLRERLWTRGPAARHIASQLMRCATSIGANAEEAQEGQTKAEYIAKMMTARSSRARGESRD